MPHGKVRKVEVFGGQVGPYGDSVLNLARPRSYHSTMHGEATHRGFVPFPTENDVDFPSGAVAEYVAPIEWKDANGVPFIIVVGGANLAGSVAIKSDGTDSLEESFAGKAIDPAYAALAATLHSDGGQVPRIYAAFGSGAIERRDQELPGSETWWTRVDSLYRPVSSSTGTRGTMTEALLSSEDQANGSKER